MAWMKPVERNLAAYMSQEEIDAFRQYMGYDAKSGTMKDPVADALEDTAAMVRGYCHVKLDDDPFTIPQSLMSSAMVIARYRILTRMALPVEEARRTDYDHAMSHLELVAKGEVLVESPTGVEDDSARVIPLYGLSFRPNLLR